MIHQLLTSPWKLNIYLIWRCTSAGTLHWLVGHVFPDVFKDDLKHQKLLVQQHSVKFQKTRIFINTNVRTSNPIHNSHVSVFYLRKTLYSYKKFSGSLTDWLWHCFLPPWRSEYTNLDCSLNALENYRILYFKNTDIQLTQIFWIQASNPSQKKVNFSAIM